MKLTIQTGQDNALLRKKSSPVKTQEFHAFKTLGETMLAFIKNPKNKGIGLAAPQVGINKRIIVVGLPKDREDESYPYALMINPTILQESQETTIDEEWCLSLINMVGNVIRAKEIEVEWYDIRGKKLRKNITWYGARVIQHEVDHLDGVLICDKFVK